MSSKELSIVIRCGDDPNVLDCISSIDCDSEIIVSFTGNSDLAKRIRRTGALCVETVAGNLSSVSNTGVEKASGNYVVITDSDTVFEPGTLEKLKNALVHYKVARARIRFMNPSNKFFTGIIASARDYVNNLRLVYTPGIAIRRDLLGEVQGRLFNDVVHYAVDADLDLRIKRAGIPVAFLEDSYIRHSAISVKHDLQAAFRIGKGCARSISFWNADGRLGDIPVMTLKGVPPYLLPDLLKKKGFMVLIYQLIWDLFYWTGFFVERYGN